MIGGPREDGTQTIMYVNPLEPPHPPSHKLLMIGGTREDSHTNNYVYKPVPGKYLGIVGQDLSDSKSNRLHVDIFRFCFVRLKYILWIPLKRSVNFLKS